jgi:hypothetical protein
MGVSRPFGLPRSAWPVLLQRGGSRSPIGTGSRVLLNRDTREHFGQHSSRFGDADPLEGPRVHLLAEGKAPPHPGQTRLSTGREIVSIPSLSACCSATGMARKGQSHPDLLGEMREPVGLVADGGQLLLPARPAWSRIRTRRSHRASAPPRRRAAGHVVKKSMMSAQS